MKIAVFENESGGVSLLIPAPGKSLSAVVHKNLPKGQKFTVANTKDLPDRTFRDAWKKEGRKITVDVNKAKDLTHTLRRMKREIEFKPHDEIIMKQIPGKDSKDVETEREKIRQKYWVIQDEIDACNSPDELKEIIAKENLDGLHI